MDWDPNGLEVQLAAVGAALLAAIGLNWTEKRWVRIQEPLIGILFILAATGGILLLAGNPHGSEHLKELLVGQILWTTWSSIGPIAVLYAVVLAIWFLFRSRFSGLTFYLAFAVVVTASVQIVGIYLVFASLIIPALATTGIRRGNRLLAGYIIGAISYLVGIVLSFLLDLPTGAVIVWSMAAVATLVGIVISDKRSVA
jgi:zinc/manganese transport system permease protein